MKTKLPLLFRAGSHLVEGALRSVAVKRKISSGTRIRAATNTHLGLPTSLKPGRFTTCAQIRKSLQLLMLPAHATPQYHFSVFCNPEQVHTQFDLTAEGKKILATV